MNDERTPIQIHIENTVTRGIGYDRPELIHRILKASYRTNLPINFLQAADALDFCRRLSNDPSINFTDAVSAMTFKPTQKNKYQDIFSKRDYSLR
ncbi:MAG: hypothetical protein AABX11_00715 [Nanoarchaeota archaeon]